MADLGATRRPALSFVRSTLAVLGAALLAAAAAMAYMAFSPHLLLDPVNRAIYRAPAHPDQSGRSADVALVPTHLPAGSTAAEALTRLEAAGFSLVADYAPGAAEPVRNPGNSLSDAQFAAMHAEARHSLNARGMTHLLERAGRTYPGCTERFAVELGLMESTLTAATGYAAWTCL